MVSSVGKVRKQVTIGLGTDRIHGPRFWFYSSGAVFSLVSNVIA